MYDLRRTASLALSKKAVLATDFTHSKYTSGKKIFSKWSTLVARDLLCIFYLYSTMFYINSSSLNGKGAEGK